MKLRTSYFNSEVLRKDITRFAPLWGLYTVFMLLFLVVMWSDYDSPTRFARSADSIMVTMGAVNCGYAGLAALCLFGDLFKARLTNALHALPLRREGWFLTHLAAGMLFCAVPNALGAVLSAAMLGQFGFLAYVWLGLMLLQYICFFGIGVFSVMCAGNGLGAAAVYGLINFLSVLVLWLVKCFYEPVLFGVTIQTATLTRLSPVIGFCTQNYVEYDYAYEANRYIFGGFIGESWLYVLFAVLSGAGLLVAALFMYRRRNLESAGDFIAFRPAAPVFLVLYSLCVGAMLYVVGEAMGNAGMETLLLIIGLTIGWFTGLMLLHRKVNVFRVKTFAGLGVLVFAFYLSVSVMWLDPIGITRYVPKADQVHAVMVAPYGSDYYYRENAAVVTEPAQIEKLTQIHQDLVDAGVENREYPMFRLNYTMNTGVVVERTYYLDPNSEHGQWMKNIYSSMTTVLGGDNLERLQQTARFIEVYSYTDKSIPEWEGKTYFEVEHQDYAGLLNAIAMDCEAGNMTQIWDYHQDEELVANLNIQFGSGSVRDVQVYESCIYTANYLKNLAANAEISD